MFAIICNARSGKTVGVRRLALIDRSKTRRRWWTSDNEALIQVFADRPSADAKAAQLTKNNARVVPLAEAQALIRAQKTNIHHVKEEKARARDHAECMDAFEAGWDGHKNVF